MQLTNFRDLGGLTGHDGKRVKEKMLLRAGEPVGLLPEDLKKLREVYNLSHIIDFRGEREVEEKPVDPIEGALYQNIDIMASDMKKEQAPSLETMVKHLKPGLAHDFMTPVYTKLVVSEDAKKGYRAFIDSLLDAKGSLLFHCMAGKDRTGWGAVIILKILGVSDEDIMADYLATIDGRKEANARMVEAFRQKGLPEEQLEVFNELMSVKESYLRTAFETVEKEFETFDNYLKTALQVKEDEIMSLRQRYLA